MINFKSFLGQDEDDRLFDHFLRTNQEMNGPLAMQFVEQMSDECLLKTTFKIDELAKSDPGYMLLNTILFSAFTKRPHLRNPFI